MATKIKICLLFVVLLGACSKLNNSPTVNDDFPSKILMTAQDLPSGWQMTSFNFEEVPNAKSRSVDYHVSFEPNKLYFHVLHQLVVYPNENEAVKAYSEWESKYFPTNDWRSPFVNDFNPKGLFRLECLNQNINGQPFIVCRYIQKYKNLISLVLANLDGAYLNLEQLINALKILDIRMQQHG